VIVGTEKVVCPRIANPPICELLTLAGMVTPVVENVIELPAPPDRTYPVPDGPVPNTAVAAVRADPAAMVGFTVAVPVPGVNCTKSCVPGTVPFSQFVPVAQSGPAFAQLKTVWAEAGVEAAIVMAAATTKRRR
jgi:hypothetical protein